MQKSHFPWILAGILVVAYAGWHLLGLVLASAVLAVIYLSSLRLHPRIRHARCNGTGEHRSPLFPWVFRKCPGCNSGRLIRWGARQWGAGHIRAEHARAKAARAAARENSTWR